MAIKYNIFIAIKIHHRNSACCLFWVLCYFGVLNHKKAASYDYQYSWK